MIPTFETIDMFRGEVTQSIQIKNKKNASLQLSDVFQRNSCFSIYIQETHLSSLLIRLSVFCCSLKLTPDLDSWHKAIPLLMLYAPTPTFPLLLQEITQHTATIHSINWQQNPIVSLVWEQDQGTWLYIIIRDTINTLKFKLSPMGLVPMMSLGYHENRLQVIHTVRCVFDCNHVSVTKHQQSINAIFACIRNCIEQLEASQDLDLSPLLNFRLTCCVLHQLAFLPVVKCEHIIVKMLSVIPDLTDVSSVYMTMTKADFILVTYERRTHVYQGEHKLIISLEP